MFTVTVAESNNVERSTFNNLPAARDYVSTIIDMYQDDGIEMRRSRRMVKVVDIFQRETVAIIRLEVN
jgi:hypothetical protein